MMKRQAARNPFTHTHTRPHSPPPAQSVAPREGFVTPWARALPSSSSFHGESHAHLWAPGPIAAACVQPLPLKKGKPAPIRGGRARIRTHARSRSLTPASATHTPTRVAHTHANMHTRVAQKQPPILLKQGFYLPTTGWA